jgi:hypothetical protein
MMYFPLRNEPFTNTSGYFIRMKSAAIKEIKRKAANIVFSRFGAEMDSIIKYHLKPSYALCLAREDEYDFSLDRIHFGLSLMLGQSHANELLRQMTEEIKILLSEQAA